jgi:hypothetical protein
VSSYSDERWRPHHDLDGYEVSDHGRIRSVDRTIDTVRGPRRLKGRVLAQVYDRATGYLRVGITVGGVCQPSLVHRIVCWAWWGPPPPEHEVRHLDGSRDNNHWTNLRWGTASSNRMDRLRHGTYGSKLSPADVLEIRELLRTGCRQKNIAAHFGICQGMVSRIKTRDAWDVVA